jgi:Family of unknown function (DUF6178)
MSDPPAPAVESRRILALARQDRNAARRELARQDVAAQVALVCETPVAARREILDLLPSPEAVVPALPEAELCFTAKAIGLADASWVLAHATPEQLVACLDLDAWSAAELVPDRQRLTAWLAALAESGEEALLAGARALDPELLVLWLQDRIEVWLSSDEPDFQPPPGAQTLEGVFYFRARREDDDLADVRALLDVLFREEYWTYFRMLQGTRWELESEAEEWALRWRAGRLEDLGFPPLEEAMSLYGIVPARSLDDLPGADAEVPPVDWRLAIWMPRLPVADAASHSIFRALAALAPDERRPYLFGFLSLANRVAVADRLPLGDAETIPAALEKAAALVSRGLDHLVAVHDRAPTEVLRRAGLERLFRVGFSLARRAGDAIARRPAEPDYRGETEPAETTRAREA